MLNKAVLSENSLIKPGAAATTHSYWFLYGGGYLLWLPQKQF